LALSIAVLVRALINGLQRAPDQLISRLGADAQSVTRTALALLSGEEWQAL